MHDFTRRRYPENGQTTRVRAELQARLPGVAIESNVPVVTTLLDRNPLTDIDILVEKRAIVLLKSGRGIGQLGGAELFCPTLRDRSVNLEYLVYNPDELPVVVFVTRLGTHLERA